jgi:hypothetical protein|tara:strand:- start:144 stop:335 length:192 start_codon:yes stop_codon:yes gene_type:complete
MEILKKYKHGELGAVPSLKKEKLDSKLMSKYKHGELSTAQGKRPNDKLESFAKEKYAHGSHNK